MNTIELSKVDWINIIDYNELTGRAKWKFRVSPSANKDDLVGSKHKNGYIKFLYKRKTYLLHRVLFFISTGLQPQEIDHVNGVKSDNRSSNLRGASRRQNEYNKPVSKESKTGVKGVSLNDSGTYRARVRVNGKRVTLGSFLTIDKAEKEVISFRKSFQGDFCHDH